MGQEGIFKKNYTSYNTTAVRHSSRIAFPQSKALELKSLKTSANDVASVMTHPYIPPLKGPAPVCINFEKQQMAGHLASWLRPRESPLTRRMHIKNKKLGGWVEKSARAGMINK